MNTQAFIPSGARDVAGVLLAGGQSRRFGNGDKCLQVLGGKTLLERAALNAAPQVGALILSINGDESRFPDLGIPLLHDDVKRGPDEASAGPLAGVLTAMDCVASHVPQARWIATFATDAPFIPVNWVARVKADVTREGADMGVAMSNGRTHPVFGLWPVEQRYELRRAIEKDSLRKVDEWTARFTVSVVDFEGDRVDPFFNINTPDDLTQAAAHV